MKVVYEGARPVGVFIHGAYQELEKNRCIIFKDNIPIAIATLHWEEGEIYAEGTLDVTKEMEDFFHGIVGRKYG